MDIHSTEFYVMAFGVAIALVALLFGQRDRGAAATRIVALNLEPDEANQVPSLSLHMLADGLHIERRGLSLPADDTVNLVATIIDDKVHVAEKRGVVGRGEVVTLCGKATIPLNGKERWHVRYESEVTGQWCLIAIKAREGAQAYTEMKY